MSLATPQRVADGRPRAGIPGFALLQRLGKSLMLPIALLPAAGILLRLGQDDLLGKIDAPVIGPFLDAMTAAGDAVFANLGLLFAVGVAIGMARKADGSTALSAVAGYLVVKGVFEAMSPVVLAGKVDKSGEQAMIQYGVFAGIIVGILTAVLFDRFHTIKLPSYLGFFGGRRFVPIVVSLTALILGFLLSYFYPVFDAGLGSAGHAIAQSGAIGAFIYGFLNRMLIPLGLHHIVNSYIWFVYGDYTGGSGVVHGDLTRFTAGDPTAGALTAGFYPIIMFGLPAAALAMMRAAKPGQRKVAAGVLLAGALTAFLTGITEPLEFAFVFVAFPLYVIHALLTGVSLAIAYQLDIHLGFSFSPSLIDLLLYGTASSAKNIPTLLLMGLVTFGVYYALFSFAIRQWNLRTPGRDDTADVPRTEPDQPSPEAVEPSSERAPETADAENRPAGVVRRETVADTRAKAGALVAALGGARNLRSIDACITRLRVEVVDQSRVDREAIRSVGALGVVEIGNGVQAVFGTESDTLRAHMEEIVGSDPTEPVEAAPRSSIATAASAYAAMPPKTYVVPPPRGYVATVPNGYASTAVERSSPVLAPLAGDVVGLDEVPDRIFASGMVGQGLAIEPREDVVDVVAPLTGTVQKLWPHAFLIRAAGQVSILVHPGINTVQLEGVGFTSHIEEGAEVQAGQKVMTYDAAAVRRSGRSAIVPVVILEPKGGDWHPSHNNSTVQPGEPLFSIPS